MVEKAREWLDKNVIDQILQKIWEEAEAIVSDASYLSNRND